LKLQYGTFSDLNKAVKYRTFGSFYTPHIGAEATARRFVPDPRLYR